MSKYVHDNNTSLLHCFLPFLQCGVYMSVLIIYLSVFNSLPMMVGRSICIHTYIHNSVLRDGDDCDNIHKYVISLYLYQ